MSNDLERMSSTLCSTARCRLGLIHVYVFVTVGQCYISDHSRQESYERRYLDSQGFLCCQHEGKLYSRLSKATPPPPPRKKKSRNLKHAEKQAVLNCLTSSIAEELTFDWQHPRFTCMRQLNTVGRTNFVAG